MKNQIGQFWPTEKSIDDCIQPEAEIPPAAVLLAVHRPLELTLVEDKSRRPIKEVELLDRLLDPNVERGTALITIRGSSGVGKSHAIRWLDAKLRARSDAPSRHIILLPKSTSLKGAIKEILKNLSGPAFDALKKRLQLARDYLDVASAAIELRAKIEIQFDRKIRLAQAAIAAARTRNQMPSEQDKIWRDHQQLIGVLGHPALRERWVGVGPDEEPIGVLAQVASRILKDGLIVNDQTRLQFKPEDLTFDVEELRDVAGATRQYLTQLGMSGGQQKVVAVGLLNSVIDEAANQLLDLGDSGLKDLFDEIRQELLKQDKELIVLVEDFAVLSGMQGALLDALIKEGIRDGKKVRCTMRTAMAVTTGYQLPATVGTRTTGEIEIEDAPFQTEEDTFQAIAQLVGRYLNAARVGREVLEAAYQSQGVRSNAWVPRFENSIELDDEQSASLKAFGASPSPDEYSLFPFNQAALRQLVSIREDKKLEFKPRNILKHIVRRTLLEYRSAFSGGSFPPAGYFEADGKNKVANAVASEIKKNEANPAQAARLIALIRFWGDNPSSPRRADWNLPSKVYQTFGLLDLSSGLPSGGQQKVIDSENIETAKPNEGPSQLSAGTNAKDVISPPPPPPPPPQEFDLWRQAIDDWASGRLAPLPQDKSLKLRGWIAGDVLASINWDAEMLVPPSGETLSKLRAMVFIAKAAGRGNATEANCSILAVKEEDLTIPEKSEEMALTLQALIRWKLEGSWSFDHDGRSYNRWALFISERKKQAVQFLEKFSGSELLEPAAKALYLGTRMLNIPGSQSNNPAQLVNALFKKLDNPPLINNSKRGEIDWASVGASAAEHRSRLQSLVLRFVGARTAGRGEPHAIHFPRLSAALGDVAASLALPKFKAAGDGRWEDANDQLAAEHIKLLQNHFKSVVSDRVEKCRQRIEACEKSFGRQLDLKKLRREVDEVADKGYTLLSLSREASVTLKASVESYATLYSGINLSGVPEKDAPLSAKLAFAASVNEEQLIAAERMLSHFEVFSKAAENKMRLESLAGGAGSFESEQEAFKKTLENLGSLLKISVSDISGAAKSVSRSEKDKVKAKAAKSESAGSPSSEPCPLTLRCQELILKLDQHASQTDFKFKAEALRSHREKFEEKLVGLETAMKPWLMLESFQIAGLVRPVPGSNVSADLPEVFNRVSNTPEQVNAGQQMRNCLTALGSLASDYDNKAKIAWETIKQSRFCIDVPAPLIEMFRQLPGLDRTASELEVGLRQLEEAVEYIPASKKDWMECQDAFRRCEQLLKKLPLDNIPPEIKEFLGKAVAADGAPLSSLTASVLKWIGKYELGESFVIRSAGSNRQQYNRLY